MTDDAGEPLPLGVANGIPGGANGIGLRVEVTWLDGTTTQKVLPMSGTGEGALHFEKDGVEVRADFTTRPTG